MFGTLKRLRHCREHAQLPEINTKKPFVNSKSKRAIKAQTQMPGGFDKFEAVSQLGIITYPQLYDTSLAELTAFVRMMVACAQGTWNCLLLLL